METYKIVLIGDEGVGKTTLVEKHKNGRFLQEHNSTLGVEVDPIRFEKTCFNVWDCGSKFPGLGDGYYKEAHGCIIMFDLSRKESFLNVPTWINHFRNICPNSPIVICGNKCEENQDIHYGQIVDMILYHKVDYIQISLKNGLNVTQPFEKIYELIKQ